MRYANPTSQYAYPPSPRSPRRSYRGAELGEQQVNDIGRCADKTSLGGGDLTTTAASRRARQES
jgi:hypothetical protein